METQASAPPSAPIPNVLVDSALTEIRQRIVQQGYSEIHLPPSENEFSEKKLGITWTGNLILTNGKLHGMETLHRVGEATISFNEFVKNVGQHAEITFTVDLGLTAPRTTHDFRVTFMKKEMEGMVNGILSNVMFTIILGLNILTRKMRLIDLKFKQLGHVETEIKGLGVVLDFLASQITKVMLNRIKWEMANVVEGHLKKTIGEIIGGMKWPMPDQQNQLIGGIQSMFGVSGGGATENGEGHVPGPSRKSK